MSIIKKKAEWVVSAKYTTKKDQIEYAKENNEDLTDSEYWDDFSEVEIAVVRRSNKHGLKSYGWADFDKIILFTDVGEDWTKENMSWAKRIATIVRDALNDRSV
jgi:hypothetical protein